MIQRLKPFVLDCMDAGGRATHGAVAESLSKHEWFKSLLTDFSVRPELVEG